MRNKVLLALLVATLAGTLSAQQLDTLATNYRKTPSARTRAALLRFAQAHPNDKNGALALLVLGGTEVDQRQFGDALQHLKAAGKRLPDLADYAAYWSAVSQAEVRDFSATEATLAPVWQSTPPSPLVAKAVELQVSSFLQLGRSAQALALVQQHLNDLSIPQQEILLARSYESAGNAEQAAVHYLKVHSEYPLSREATEAEGALVRFPQPDPKALLGRGLRLVDAGDYARASKELTALLPRLNGADLDLARVRIGAARYLARETRPAYEYLNSFQTSGGETEAERLYYLLECARRLDRIDEMKADLDKLAQSYGQSGWRLRGMVTVANYDASHNDAAAAEPLYRACYESFPKDPQSLQCHWKIAWSEYLRGRSSAAALLEDHLKRYPESDHTTTALYFLGRIAEDKGDWGAARVYYEQINSAFPNYYYAMLGRERLHDPKVASAVPSLQAAQFLAALPFTRRGNRESFLASVVTKKRIERAHLLAGASMDDWAEDELRFGAKVDGQPALMAMELADLANQRDAPDQGIRYIKRLTPGYMSVPIDTASEKFWRLAFPLPYRHSLELYSKEHSLDPFLVAALIRQESEFNAKAVSRANARGLTQVMPATGRELSRKLKIPRYSTRMLFTPDTNLQIGTYYLKALVDQLQGKWEAALASYNAGKSRAVAWMASTEFREPAEFVESIPFNETRVYVQSVLRNAEVYRRLYGQAR